MSIFGAIRDAIFGRAAQQVAPQAAQASAIGAAAASAAEAAPAVQAAAPGQPVDVEAVLTGIERTKGGSALNWRSSIVDLMKLLDMDSSLDNRKELATELGYTGARDGSAEMNIWLHRRVMEELAKHGGRVPATMTD